MANSTYASSDSEEEIHTKAQQRLDSYSDVVISQVNEDYSYTYDGLLHNDIISLNDGTVIRIDIDILIGVPGHTLGALHYWDPFTNRDYLFVIRNDGKLFNFINNVQYDENELPSNILSERRNSNSRWICLETRILFSNDSSKDSTTPTEAKLIIDENYFLLFCCCYPKELFVIKLRRSSIDGQQLLSFETINNDGLNKECIYLPISIDYIYYDISYHEEYATGNEFLFVSALVNDYLSNTFHLYVYQYFPKTSAKRSKTVKDGLHFKLLIDKIIDTDSTSLTLKAVYNVGIIIFTELEIIVVPIDSINSSLVINNFRFNSASNSKDNVYKKILSKKLPQKFFKDVIVSPIKNNGSLQFTLILKNSFRYITIHLNLIFNDIENGLAHYEDFIVDDIKQFQTNTDDYVITNVYYSTALTTKFFVITFTNGLLYTNIVPIPISNFHFIPSQICRLKNKIKLDSLVIENPVIKYEFADNFNKLISIDVVRDESSIMTINYFALENIFNEGSYRSLTQNCNTKIKNIWNTDNGIFYIDDLNILSKLNDPDFEAIEYDIQFIPKNSDIIKDFDPDNVIAISNIQITHSSSNEQLERFSNDFVFIDSNGVIRSSNSKKIFVKPIRLQNFNKLSKFVISSIYFQEKDSLQTVILNDDNQLLILENYATGINNKRIISLESILDNSVCHEILITQHNHLFLSDISGYLYDIDIVNNKLINKVKISDNRLNFEILSMEKHYTLVYSVDCLFIIMFNSKFKKYHINRIDIDLSLKRISVLNENNIIFLTKDNKILQSSFADNSVSCFKPSSLITKAVTFKNISHLCLFKTNISQQYIISSSLKSNESINSFNIDSSGANSTDSILQIHDIINKGEVAYTFNLSEMFPNSFVTSIISLPYKLRSVNTLPYSAYIKSQNYAKNLTFKKCFLVSLDYENHHISSTSTESTTALLKNLLLFSIDPSNGSLELQGSFSLGTNIIKLIPYKNEAVIVFGDCVNIISIDYSIQENIFNINVESNNLYFPYKLQGCESIEDHSNNGQLLASLRVAHKLIPEHTRINRMICLTKDYNLKEVLIITNLKATKSEKKYLIVPNISSESLEIINTWKTPMKGKLLSSISYKNIMVLNIAWYALCSVTEVYLRKVKLDMIHGGEHLISEYKITLPNQIISIRSIDLSEEGKFDVNHYRGLFAINTVGGGQFIVTFLPNGGDTYLNESFINRLSDYCVDKIEEEANLGYELPIDEQIFFVENKNRRGWKILK
ncbi:hypothetical protein TBLA_0D01980 [Henningerozyma blattae CBS 6284]|uniref:Uncharacterized protein n=1 Tax=Henningerozyma blattae (strain ATCC 34711 / CBS 6284 / DSM 70876 / NBRC 10599 / NRRL Y-10934 / UCD 77-7) TaxID=1071380 RepID=I2H2V3_HENB6|nr:hypothetical protein TBLA_0D01980 [Tetrapisispora blattae CBS 6284]CCH60705.1 hypothetical protein TBLA_0D01980 [Tetrapisispora blattae CBS 6284]